LRLRDMHHAPFHNGFDGNYRPDLKGLRLTAYRMRSILTSTMEITDLI